MNILWPAHNIITLAMHSLITLTKLTESCPAPGLLHVLPIRVLQLAGVEGVEGLVDANLLGLDGHLVGQRLGSVQRHLKVTISIKSSLFNVKSAYFVSSRLDLLEEGRCVKFTNIFYSQQF